MQKIVTVNPMFQPKKLTECQTDQKTGQNRGLLQKYVGQKKLRDPLLEKKNKWELDIIF